MSGVYCTCSPYSWVPEMGQLRIVLHQGVPGAPSRLCLAFTLTLCVQAYAINELDGLQLYCAPTDSCRWLTGTDLLTEHSLNSSGLSPLSLWGVTWVFVALFQLLSILCMTFLNFEARSGSDSAIGKEPSVELANLAPSDHVHVETRSETRGRVHFRMLYAPHNGFCRFAGGTEQGRLAACIHASDVHGRKSRSSARYLGIRTTRNDDRHSRASTNPS